MAGYIGKDKVGRAALIYFKADVSQAAAEKALRLIADVLEAPAAYPDPGTGDVGDYVREYDIDYGEPVWYIP